MFPIINLLAHCFAVQTYQPCFLETVLSYEDMVICRCKLRGLLQSLCSRISILNRQKKKFTYTEAPLDLLLVCGHISFFS